MSGTDCAAFEAALADALADPRPASPETVASLRRHAAGCPACRGASALVDLAAAGADGRDPIPDPGEAYWRGFDGRLAARLGAERAARRRRRTALWLVGGAAAAAAIAAAALLGPRRAPAGAVAELPPPAATPAPASTPAPPQGRGSTTPPSPRPLDTASGEADEDADPLAWGTVSDPLAAGDEPGLFPGVDDLSPEQQRRFSEWLEGETARAAGGAA